MQKKLYIYIYTYNIYIYICWRYFMFELLVDFTCSALQLFVLGYYILASSFLETAVRCWDTDSEGVSIPDMLKGAHGSQWHCWNPSGFLRISFGEFLLRSRFRPVKTLKRARYGRFLLDGNGKSSDELTWMVIVVRFSSLGIGLWCWCCDDVFWMRYPTTILNYPS